MNKTILGRKADETEKSKMNTKLLASDDVQHLYGYEIREAYII